jgi:AraC-like DNA-binding protein
MLDVGFDPVATQLLVADGVDSYSAALPGLVLDVARTGLGAGPNIAHTAVANEVMLASVITGFPGLTRTTVADDRIFVALVIAAPPNSRWCGFDLTPGLVMSWGPGAEHTANNPGGINFVALCATRRRLEEAADELELRLELPDGGHVVPLTPNQRTLDLASLLAPLHNPMAFAPDRRLVQLEAVHAMTSALSDGGAGARSVGPSRYQASRRIVSACINYSETIHRPPSISEMCAVSHASERRVRNAFTDAFAVPPNLYFRNRALSLARSQLIRSPADGTVSEVALGAGFRNLGRFSAQYRNVFGEYPSATLRGTSVD